VEYAQTPGEPQKKIRAKPQTTSDSEFLGRRGRISLARDTDEASHKFGMIVWTSKFSSGSTLSVRADNPFSISYLQCPVTVGAESVVMALQT
jgi:hypothetical protein